MALLRKLPDSDRPQKPPRSCARKRTANQSQSQPNTEIRNKPIAPAKLLKILTEGTRKQTHLIADPERRPGPGRHVVQHLFLPRELRMRRQMRRRMEPQPARMPGRRRERHLLSHSRVGRLILHRSRNPMRRLPGSAPRGESSMCPQSVRSSASSFFENVS